MDFKGSGVLSMDVRVLVAPIQVGAWYKVFDLFNAGLLLRYREICYFWFLIGQNLPNSRILEGEIRTSRDRYNGRCNFGAVRVRSFSSVRLVFIVYVRVVGYRLFMVRCLF